MGIEFLDPPPDREDGPIDGPVDESTAALGLDRLRHSRVARIGVGATALAAAVGLLLAGFTATAPGSAATTSSPTGTAGTTTSVSTGTAPSSTASGSAFAAVYRVKAAEVAARDAYLESYPNPCLVHHEYQLEAEAVAAQQATQAAAQAATGASAAAAEPASDRAAALSGDSGHAAHWADRG